MVTRKAIAERTGVSLTVISHVLNNTPNARVSPETREKVVKAAQELGYVANALGRALVEKRIRHIGLAINCQSGDDDSIRQKIISGITRCASEHDYHVLLCPLKNRIDKNLAENLASLVQSGRVDGLIINKEDVLTSEVEKLVKLQLPLVLLNNYFTLPIPCGSQIHSVCLDLTGGTRYATVHLLENGHRRIALFRTENGVFPKENHRGSDQCRERGFVEALQSQGMPLDRDLVAVGDFSRTEDIELAVQKLDALPEPPDALVAATDAIALKAFYLLKQAGIRLAPEAVIGGGDLFFRHYIPEKFPSLHLPLESMGKLAAEQVLRKIDDPTLSDGVTVVLPVTLSY